MPVLQQPLYLPDLASFNFWLFPKLEFASRGIHFGSFGAVKTKLTKRFKVLKEKDFQHCFNH